MVTLKQFKFNWKALNEALNTIVDAVNRNSPLEGDNVHLDEKGTQGVSINAAVSNSGVQNQGQGGGGGISGTLKQIIVFDTSGNPMTLNVWTDGQDGKSAGDPFWSPMTVVNPADCSSSTVTVLIKT